MWKWTGLPLGHAYNTPWRSSFSTGVECLAFGVDLAGSKSLLFRDTGTDREIPSMGLAGLQTLFGNKLGPTRVWHASKKKRAKNYGKSTVFPRTEQGVVVIVISHQMDSAQWAIVNLQKCRDLSSSNVNDLTIIRKWQLSSSTSETRSFSNPALQCIDSPLMIVQVSQRAEISKFIVDLAEVVNHGDNLSLSTPASEWVWA